MAGDAETGVSIMRLTAGLDSGPGLPAGARADPARRRLRHAGRAAGARSAATCSCARSTSARRSSSRTRRGVTYAHKIEARDRALDPTRPPEEVERDRARAAPAHRRPAAAARRQLPRRGRRARRRRPTLAPAGGRVRAEGERLLLDCNGGALELTEIRPPGGRPMAAADWLRGRPDPALDRLLAGPAAARRARSRSWSSWPSASGGSDAEWAPHLSALACRGDEEVLDAARELLAPRRPARPRASPPTCSASSACPSARSRPSSAAALEAMARARRTPTCWRRSRARSATSASRTGIETLLRLRRHADARVREGVGDALGGPRRRARRSTR